MLKLDVVLVKVLEQKYIYSLDDVMPIKSLTQGFIVVRNIITTFTNKRKNIL